MDALDFLFPNKLGCLDIPEFGGATNGNSLDFDLTPNPKHNAIGSELDHPFGTMILPIESRSPLPHPNFHAQRSSKVRYPFNKILVGVDEFN